MSIGGGGDLSRANEYKVCSGSWHHKTIYGMCYGNSLRGKRLKKQTKKILDLVRLFSSMEGIYRYFLASDF